MAELRFCKPVVVGSIPTVSSGERAERAAAEGGTPELAVAAEAAVTEAQAALFDDLNAPEALAALFTFIRRGNSELDRRGADAAALEKARAAFSRINGVLDLAPDREIQDPELAQWVEARLRERREARARRDFAEADRIRGELSQRGIAVEDTAGGTKWKKVR